MVNPYSHRRQIRGGIPPRGGIADLSKKIALHRVSQTSLATTSPCPWYDFSNRSDSDKQHATTRAYVEHLPLENSSILAREDSFLEDLARVKQSHYYSRLSDVNQFHPGKKDGLKTRASHTEHVEIISREICRALHLTSQSEDLAATIASIHDIGHPPFAHDGEDALRERMKQFGGTWDHDMMGLRVITEMSNMGLTFPGMNLSLDVIEGLAKRYWRYTEDARKIEKEPHFFHPFDALPQKVKEIDKRFGLHLQKQNHLEGQIAAAADWIAFTVTDIEDALKTGMLTFDDLAKACPIAKEVYDNLISHKQRSLEKGVIIKSEPGNLSSSTINTLVDALKNRLIADTVSYAKAQLLKAKNSGTIKNAEDIRNLDELIISFSPQVHESLQIFNAYCHKHLWPDTRARYSTSPTQMVGIVFDDLFRGYVDVNEKGNVRRIDLTKEYDTPWARKYKQLKAAGPAHDKERARLICEYITIFFTDSRVEKYMARYHKGLYSLVSQNDTSGRNPAYFEEDENLGTFTQSVSDGRRSAESGPAK